MWSAIKALLGLLLSAEVIEIVLLLLAIWAVGLAIE